jgi:hypothetical protein
MKTWTSFGVIVTLFVTAAGTEGCPPARADDSAGNPAMMDMDAMNMGSSGTGSAAAGSSPTAAASPSAAASPAPHMAQPAGAQAEFETLKRLIGKWEAPMGANKTLVDTFQPFAFGTAILAEEWVGDQQITSTVFYMVGSELRADHYCDYLNQPRYVAKPGADPAVIDFQFREATNLDAHPTHFHATTWRVIDDTHMTQDWAVEGSPTGNKTMRLEFVRKQ